MKNKMSFKEALDTFLTFLKLGALSFGGGNTLMSMLEHELVEKKQWITSDELFEMLAVAEVTPGPMAINIATYIGYKKGGWLGAALTTLGVLIPPVICMFLLATFLDKLQSLTYVNYMLSGLKCAVILILGTMCYKFIKKSKIDFVGVIIMSAMAIAEILITIFNLSISAIYFVIAGGLVGLLVYGILPRMKEKKEKKIEESNND